MTAIPRQPTTPAVLAFYLPQFHPIPENDQWWGTGFTEWRNVARARPLYDDHYQPHLPGELGFYDLRMPHVRSAQADLAAAHGITGFCYYHYWFHGRRLLEMPFSEVLRTGEPDFPFCLCWANEPWTRNWDGGDRDVLVSQSYSPQDDREHITFLIEAFRDGRYIRVGDRPVLFVYNVASLPDPEQTTKLWRQECERAGIGDPYLVQFETFGLNDDPAVRGFDASAEFLPHQVLLNMTAAQRNRVDDPEYHNEIFWYDDLAEVQADRDLPPWTRYQCVVPNWDNTPRKPNGGANLFLGSTPDTYERWLRASVHKAQMARHEFVLLNAWNEWAEGAHLEPDVRHGRAYLEATARALGVEPSRPPHLDMCRVDANPVDAEAAELRRQLHEQRTAAAREIEVLLHMVQELRDELRAPSALGPPGSAAELLPEPQQQSGRRASSRLAGSMHRLPIVGRTLRTIELLRSDWQSL
jgi:lipopolysaccharide biosynthesis protein